jgi:hypothetical protein
MIRVKTLGAACLSSFFLLGCVSETSTKEAPKPVDSSIEPVSGISKDALAAVMAIGPQVGIFFYPDKIDPAQKAAAPAKVCAAQKRKVDSFKDVPLVHQEEMPGARHLVVYCK